MTQTKLKTVNIKGKEYVEVNERLKYFREKFPEYSLTSEIVKIEDGLCVIKATIRDENGVAKATGIAYERETSSFINKTSFIENCETSAWGRALGNFGIGIDSSIASAEEVENAQLIQDEKEESNKPPTEAQINYLRVLLKKMHKTKSEADEICAKCKTSKQASKWIEKAQKKTNGEEVDDFAYDKYRDEQSDAAERYNNSLIEHSLDQMAGY